MFYNFLSYMLQTVNNTVNIWQARARLQGFVDICAFLTKDWKFYGYYPTRTSRPVMFCEKCVLKNFAEFTGKRLCRSLFLIKLLAGDLQLF